MFSGQQEAHAQYSKDSEVLALWPGDGKWYHATVLACESQRVQVQYCDDKVIKKTEIFSSEGMLRPR